MTEPVAGNPGDPTPGTPYPPQTYGSPASPSVGGVYGSTAGDGVYGSPATYGTPASPTYGTPAYGTPAPPNWGASTDPGYGASADPGYGVPADPGYGDPGYGAPTHGRPAPPTYGTPGPGTYGSAAPSAYGNPVSTPPAPYGNPVSGAPDAYGTPSAYGNPVSGGALQPYAPAAAVPYGEPYGSPAYPGVSDDRLVGPGARLGAVLLDVLLAIVTLWIGWLIWALITWSDGQTPAKKLLGHVVVDANTGQVFDWGRMALREFVIKGLLGGLLNTVTFSIYFLVDSFMIFGNRNQTLHDKMSTSVVRYL